MSTSTKRKSPPTSNEDNNISSKRLRLTNHSHPERTPVLHTFGNSFSKSLNIIDFATVLPDSITIVHAPDGLTTKGARRKWRDDMRARALEVQAKAKVVEVKVGGVGVDGGGSGKKRNVSDSLVEVKATVDVRAVARTRLVRPVAKEWHASSGEYEAAGGTRMEDRAVTFSDRTDANAEQRAAATVKAASTTAPTVHPQKRPTDPPPRRALPISKPPGLQRFEDIPMPRRNVPQLDDDDVSSESESDSSEDEDDTAVRAPVRGSISESFADRIFAPDLEDAGGKLDGPASGGEPPADDQNATLPRSDKLEERPDAYGRTADARDGIVTDGKARQDEEYNAGGPLPRNARQQDPSKRASERQIAVQPIAPLQTPTGTAHERDPSTAQQANVVIKKSAADGNLGGNHSGSGPSSTRSGTLTEVSSNRMSTPQNIIDPADDSEDVYDDIENVTEEVLGDSILSMDQCKLPHSRDSACEVDLDTLMTTDDSARKVPTSQDVVVMMAHDDGSSFDDWALEDADVPLAMREQSGGQESRLETGSAVIDQGDANERIAPDRSPISSSSSSNLTELSRTPTPATAPEYEDMTPVVAADDSQAENPVLPASHESLQVGVPLRRKMTGMSSKHFSPAKRLRTRESGKTKLQTPGKGTASGELMDTDSPLTALQTALDRIGDPAADAAEVVEDEAAHSSVSKEMTGSDATPKTRSKVKKESKPASGRKRKTAVNGGNDALIDADSDSIQAMLQDNETQTPIRQTRANARTPASKRKSTGKISEHFITDRVDLYNTTAGGGRIPAGTSRAPVPSINATMFGLIQEKIWREPFWLIIAVTFLNKTAGRSAVPVFWKLKEKYPTSEALADADQADLLEMVRHLGLQNQRSKRLIQIAKAWTAEPPVAGKRYRTLNYPDHGDGKASTTPNIVDEDAEDCAGLLEIGNIPGCGQYAYDSWRIFCRDPLRGVADDYNGTSAKAEGFVPEWQRVLPDDKELRACLRWMWLRESWIWDPLTGEKRRATEEELEKAVRGEMEIEDPQERKFAAQAAGVPVSVKKVKRGGNDRSLGETPAKTPSRPPIDHDAPVDVDLENGKDAPSDVPRTEASAATRALIAEESAAELKTNVRKRGRSKRASVESPVDEHKLRRSSRKRAGKFR